ncbi:MAG: hypothetical protein AB8G96_11445 [Phycisphaerales bacterium]
MIRRGGLGDLAGILDRIDERGVVVRTEAMGDRFVSWDAIFRVEPPLAGSLSRDWLEDGTNVWRARTRIGRGDYLLAEPVLEAIAPRFIGRGDPMSLVVMEGLLRCKIATGDHAAAIVPMLESIRIRSLGNAIEPWPTLPPVIDPNAGLAPAIPPAWAVGTDRPRLARELDLYLAGLVSIRRSAQFDDHASLAADRTAMLARWYRAGLTPETADDAAAIDEARRILESTDRDAIEAGGVDAIATLASLERAIRIMEALGRDNRPPTEAERTSVANGDRHALAALLDPWASADRTDLAPAWVRDWTALLRGRRAIASDDPAHRDLGLIALLGPPARSGVERPYLAGLALALAADGLDASGRTAAADAVRTDLIARFPGHPSIKSLDGAADASEVSVP